MSILSLQGHVFGSSFHFVRIKLIIGKLNKIMEIMTKLQMLFQALVSISRERSNSLAYLTWNQH